MRLPSPLRSTWLRLALAALLPLATTACGGGGGDAPSGDPQQLADLYVDAQNGSDQDDGSAATPFKTITHAMSQATAGMVVKVEPGFYDLGNGESFPISIPNGVHLLGDPASRGKGTTPTMIIGYGPLAASLEANSTAVLTPGFDVRIEGFVVQNTHADPIIKDSGIVVASSHVELVRNTFQFNENTGVRYLAGGIFGELFANAFHDNGTGLFMKAGGQHVRVESNKFSGNGTGVLIWSADIDLGGGGAGSQGKNLIAYNDSADLVIMEQVHVMAQDNRWNHVPPTVYAGQDLSLKPDGIDIWRVWGNGSVDTTGAKLPQILIGQLPNLPIVPLGP